MKKLFATLALTGFALPALAGETCGEVQTSCASLASFRCENACPLAKEANVLRAYGFEAVVVSTVARADLADALERDLARI